MKYPIVMKKEKKTDRGFPPYRWTFLETGVDGIMRNLGEGLDMAAVSFPPGLT